MVVLTGLVSATSEIVYCHFQPVQTIVDHTTPLSGVPTTLARKNLLQQLYG